MEILGKKLHRSVTSQPCVPRELSYNTTMWRETSHCALSCQWDQKRSIPGREENKMMRGEEITTQKYYGFKRRTKHAEMKLNSQTEGERNAFSLLAGYHSFPHLLSWKVKKLSPFHTSSRASFTAHIATSFPVNRDSGLKASEAGYNFVTV